MPLIPDIVAVKDIKTITLELANSNGYSGFIKVYLGKGKNQSYLAGFSMSEYSFQWTDWDRVTKLHKSIQKTAKYKKLFSARDREKDAQIAAEKKRAEEEKKRALAEKKQQERLRTAMTKLKARYEGLGFEFIPPSMTGSLTEDLRLMQERPVLWEFSRTVELDGKNREYMTFRVPNSATELTDEIILYVILRPVKGGVLEPDYSLVIRNVDDPIRLRLSIPQITSPKRVTEIYQKEEASQTSTPAEAATPEQESDVPPAPNSDDESPSAPLASPKYEEIKDKHPAETEETSTLPQGETPQASPPPQPEQAATEVAPQTAESSGNVPLHEAGDTPNDANPGSPIPAHDNPQDPPISLEESPTE
jgi:hypothetical protein